MIEIHIRRIPNSGDKLTDYHSAKLAPLFKQLFEAGKDGWKGLELMELTHHLVEVFDVLILPHGLRYALRDLADAGVIAINPDPKRYPLN